MSGYHRGDFFERNIKGLYRAMDRALFAENSAAAGGLLQRIDPRVKVAGLFSLADFPADTCVARMGRRLRLQRRHIYSRALPYARRRAPKFSCLGIDDNPAGAPHRKLSRVAH